MFKSYWPYSDHIELFTQIIEQECKHELPACEEPSFRCADGRCAASIEECMRGDCRNPPCNVCDLPVCWNGLCPSENTTCPALPSCPMLLPYRSLSLCTSVFWLHSDVQMAAVDLIQKTVHLLVIVLVTVSEVNLLCDWLYALIGVRCPDGHCVASEEDCNPFDGCPPSLPMLVPLLMIQWLINCLRSVQREFVRMIHQSVCVLMEDSDVLMVLVQTAEQNALS